MSGMSRKREEYRPRRIDLRTITKRSRLSKKKISDIEDELLAYGIFMGRVDTKKKTMIVEGYNDNNVYNQAEVPIREFLKYTRQNLDLMVKIERLRTKVNLSEYELRKLNTLLTPTSTKKLGETGYKNYNATLKKILKKDDLGISKIQAAVNNKIENLNIKYNAFADADEVFKTLHPEIDIKLYKDKNGNFRSRKKEVEYKRLFAEALQMEFDLQSPYDDSFKGWLYHTKDIKGAISPNEESMYYGEYIAERIEYAEAERQDRKWLNRPFKVEVNDLEDKIGAYLKTIKDFEDMEE